MSDFIKTMQAGYPSGIILGCAMQGGSPVQEAPVRLPLQTLNRHGLIAGATGTGKTKTIQVFVEELSKNGIPSLVMDIKGDLSGLAYSGESKPFITERHQRIGIPYVPAAMPVELLTLGGDDGVKLRATATEFGPVLLSKILGLNDTQGGVLALLFRYSDQRSIPLIDLKDLKKMLQHLIGEGKAEIQAEYGSISPASVNTIMRKIIELEEQGAEDFFGEPSFDVSDLQRINSSGQGIISVLRLSNLQDRPKLFSTFMLSLLAEIYATFPEEGDLEKPKLVLVIDEAHLIFDEASKALLDQVETIVRLIRSKGVGVFFCTQSPTDVPEEILAQLGLKIQHALRAFTAKDRKAIKQSAENFPETDHYQTDELLTSMGIGEALVTALSVKGVPTPLVHTYLRAPASRMGSLTDAEIQQILKQSSLHDKYDELVDGQSAYEMLTARMERAATPPAPTSKPEKSGSTNKPEPSSLETFTKNPMVRQIGRAVFTELTRGLLGVLGIGRKRR